MGGGAPLHTVHSKKLSLRSSYNSTILSHPPNSAYCAVTFGQVAVLAEWLEVGGGVGATLGQGNNVVKVLCNTPALSTIHNSTYCPFFPESSLQLSPLSMTAVIAHHIDNS